MNGVSQRTGVLLIIVVITTSSADVTMGRLPFGPVQGLSQSIREHSRLSSARVTSYATNSAVLLSRRLSQWQVDARR